MKLIYKLIRFINLEVVGMFTQNLRTSSGIAKMVYVPSDSGLCRSTAPLSQIKSYKFRPFSTTCQYVIESDFVIRALMGINFQDCVQKIVPEYMYYYNRRNQFELQASWAEIQLLPYLSR